MENSKIRYLAIIPARGGSKRIPHKNIVPFLGKPLISHTINAARDAGIFDKIVVSTDDPKIAKVSILAGAEVPFLRDEKADDHSPVSEATLRTIEQLESLGEKFDVVVQLFAVCPLRNAKDILDAVEFFNVREADFVLSCYKYVWMNPWWAIEINKNFQGRWVFEDAKKRSQDLPELFSPTGAVWIAKINRLKESGTFYGPNHIFWEMNWKRAVDIDHEEDLELAAAFYSMDKQKNF